jgi:plasmid stabilization system protein ParE
MRRKVVFSPEARADLFALYDYIAGRDVERALRKPDETAD